MPTRRSEAEDADDWHWTLRSATNRPILRVLEKDKDSSDSGSLVVVSHNKSEPGGSDDALKASVAFMAGAEAGGFGSAGDVTTAFALEKSLFSSGTLSLNGNIGRFIGRSHGRSASFLRAQYWRFFRARLLPLLTGILPRPALLSRIRPTLPLP